MDAILGARLRGGQVVGHLVPGGCSKLSSKDIVR